jgi:LacI family transcriptional regulator
VDIPSQEMAKSALDILILAGESRMDIPIRRELLPIYQIRESSGLEQEENYK